MRRNAADSSTATHAAPIPRGLTTAHALGNANGARGSIPCALRRVMKSSEEVVS
jgi:hypothetical protein